MSDNFAIDHLSEILDKKLSITSSQLISCISEFTNVFNDVGYRLIKAVENNTIELSLIEKSLSDLDTDDISNNISDTTEAINRLIATTVVICDGIESISKIKESIDSGFDKIIDFTTTTMNDIYATPTKYREDYENPD